MQSRFPRSSGILLHPTSLPGRWGIGDLGAAAYRFVDFLVASGQSLWQILPLGPTGFGNSPYQSPSAFAGNPLLVSLETLVEEGLLPAEALPTEAHALLSDARVNYDAVMEVKFPLLQRSFKHFQKAAPPDHASGFTRFCKEHGGWLDDYALFMALREHFADVPWYEWERDIMRREPAALERWRKKLAEAIEFRKYMQYLFFTQWTALRTYANEQKVRIIGDAPIFVSDDCVDVWANADLFYLDEQRQPTIVAGVPPDYFSATGQRWGNPLYRWDVMEKNGYAWWIERIRQTLTMVDILRLDHFRGFEAYWEIPASEETAINGTWVPGPGAKFFEVVRNALGDLPIIAEDLGLITEGVETLRDQFALPGMKVLHFAFGGGGAENPYLPHNYQNNFVAYTGTHDNDTTLGWFTSREDEEREHIQRYIGNDGSDICWDLIRLVSMSVADMTIMPLQDVLRLGTETRMNTPGTVGNNWEWRVDEALLTPGLAEGLHLLTSTYGRCA